MVNKIMNHTGELYGCVTEKDSKWMPDKAENNAQCTGTYCNLWIYFAQKWMLGIVGIIEKPNKFD